MKGTSTQKRLCVHINNKGKENYPNRERNKNTKPNFKRKKNDKIKILEIIEKVCVLLDRQSVNNLITL